MIKSSPLLNAVLPLTVATAVSMLVYNQQAALLLLKVGEVFGGVFDTSVPSFPLAGMLFVMLFLFLRRKEFEALLNDNRRDASLTVGGVVLAALPYGGVLFYGRELHGSYIFAAAALTMSWVGVLVAVKPPVFRFIWPYLAVYLAAVGSVGALTNYFGDPLAIVVASISNAMTSAMRLPVQWSAVNISFLAAGGGPVSLYISQECSGIASMSIFLLLMGLMYLDMKPSPRRTLVVTALGALLFVFLNALRVVVLIVAGIYSGTDLLWNLHGWVGYVFYIVGYAGVLAVVFRAPHTPKPLTAAAG